MSSPAPLVSSPSVASETLTRRAGDLKLLGDSDAIQDVIQTLAAFDAAAAGKSWIDLASDTSAKGISARHRMLLAHAAVEVSRAKDEWLSHLAEEKAERETLARDVMEFAQLFSKVSSEASRERAEREANAWAKESAAPKEEEEGLDEAEDVLFSANVDGHGGSGGVAEAVNGSDVQAAAAKDAVTSSAYLSNTNMGCGATTYASASRRKARPRRWPQVDGPPEMSTQTSCSLPSSTNMPADLGGAGTRGGGGAQPTAPSCDAWSQSPARGAASKGSSSQCSSAMSGGQANSSSSSASPRWKALSGATHATLALRTVTRGSPRARPQAAHQGCAEQPVGGSQTTDADGAASAVAPFGAQNAQQQSDAGGAASLKEGVAAGGADGTEGGPFWTSIIHSSTANRVPSSTVSPLTRDHRLPSCLHAVQPCIFLRSRTLRRTRGAARHGWFRGLSPPLQRPMRCAQAQRRPEDGSPLTRRLARLRPRRRQPRCAPRHLVHGAPRSSRRMIWPMRAAWS